MFRLRFFLSFFNFFLSFFSRLVIFLRLRLSERNEGDTGAGTVGGAGGVDVAAVFCNCNNV